MPGLFSFLIWSESKLLDCIAILISTITENQTVLLWDCLIPGRIGLPLIVEAIMARKHQFQTISIWQSKLKLSPFYMAVSTSPPVLVRTRGTYTQAACYAIEEVMLLTFLFLTRV